MIRARPVSVAALAGFALLLAVAAYGQQEVRFFTPRLYPIGGIPADMKLVDLNGDTRLDVVVTNFDQGTLSVLLATPNGDLEPLADAFVTFSPTQIAAGLFDDDAFPDLVISETESDFVTFVHGNGDGTFAEPVSQPSGHDSQGLAAAHMNGDDKLDLVVSLAAEGGGHVDVLLGNGDGTFVYDPEGGRNLSAGSFGVGVADLNGDGPLDVVATTFDDRAFVLLGDGAGGLGRADPFPTGTGPFGLALADFTGDDVLDVITANGESSTVSLLRNNGAGELAEPVNFPVGFGPAKVVAVDLDADGKTDAVTANTGSGDVTVLHGDGAGGFGTPRHFAAPPHAFAAAATDINGDEMVDLLAVVEGSLVVMLARPGGYEAIESVLPGPQIIDIEQADLNGDLLPDLVASTRRTDIGVVRLLAQPGGGFGPPQQVTDRTDVGILSVADLNADGRPDVLGLSRNNPDVFAMLAQPDGSFAMAKSFELAGNGSSLVVGDFDRDGRADLAVASQAPPAVSVLFGNGDGTFEPRVVAELPAAPAVLAVGELDAMPGADLAASSLARNEIALLLSRPGRTFDLSRSVPTTAPVLALCSADFDGDGADDLAAGAQRSTAQVWYGDGTGGFTPGASQSIGTLPIVLAARDVTGDGRPDLLFADQAGSMVGAAPYAGSRTFGVAVRFQVGQSPVALAVADFDADGAYDLVGAGNTTAIVANAVAGARRGDGNGDTVLSAPDISILARALVARPISRVEDVQRDAAGVTAGADINGDGVVDTVDLSASLSRLFAGA